MKDRTIINKIIKLKLQKSSIQRSENLSDFDIKELCKIDTKIRKYERQLQANQI